MGSSDSSRTEHPSLGAQCAICGHAFNWHLNGRVRTCTAHQGECGCSGFAEKPTDSESSSPEGAHVHEWGDWAPDKLQPRNGLEYALCPCGASEARRAVLCGSCDAGLPMSCTCEPEEGACTCDTRPWSFEDPEPRPDQDCPVHGDPALLRQPAPAPRRPPYAVAYAVEGGALYEIALSGDATVVAEDGVLQIIHPSRAVLGITRVTPMTIEES